MMLNDVFERCIQTGFVNRLDSYSAAGDADQSIFTCEFTQLIIEMFENNLQALQQEEWSHSNDFALESSTLDRDRRRESLVLKIDSLFGYGNPGQSVGLLVDQMTTVYVKIKMTIDSWDVSVKDTDRLNNLLSTYFSLKVAAHGVSIPPSFPMNSDSAAPLVAETLLESPLVDGPDSAYVFQNLPETHGFWDV